jgi:peptide deformylase
VLHEEGLAGFVAHVFQHEADHLSGILFVDKVKDTTTYMMADEYRRRIVGVKV